MGERPWDDSGLDILRNIEPTPEPRAIDIAKIAGQTALGPKPLPAQEGEA
jgi:hypothetical protein